MKLLCSLFLPIFWILFSGLQASKSCTDDQYKRILQNGSAVCVDCLSCPPGLGPSVECGSTVTADTIIECRPCVAGVNFSSHYDFEQCQLCSVCSKDQESKPCTPKSDTVCEKRCMSKDKYYERTSDDCQECTWCCGDGNDKKIVECLRKGMPAQKSCTVHRRKLCKAPTTAARPTTASPTSILKSPITRVITSNEKPIEKEPTRSARKLSSNHNTFLKNKTSSQSAVKSAPTTEWQVVIGVCVGLGILSAASLICLLIVYRKRCAKFCFKSSDVESETKLQIIYTIKKEDEEVIACYKEHRLFDLFKDIPQLKDDVCKKLDLKKAFAKLGRRCKVDEDKVKRLEENPGREPTLEIFDAIEGKQPDFTFGAFAEILKEIERNDALQCCVKELSKISLRYIRE